MFSATILDAKSALDKRLQQLSVFPELAANDADAAWLEALTRADDV